MFSIFSRKHRLLDEIERLTARGNEEYLARVRAQGRVWELEKELVAAGDALRGMQVEREIIMRCITGRQDIVEQIAQLECLNRKGK